MLNKIVIGVVVMGSLVIAINRELEKFSGLEIAYETVEAKNVIGSTESNSGVKFGLKTGVQNYDWRTTISGNFFKKDEQEYFHGFLSLDKFIGVGLYESEDIIMKPYFGFHGGWLNYKDVSKRTNGLIYGLEGGFVWALSDGIDIDFGYRFSSSEVGRVDNIRSLSLGINYIF